MQSLQAGIDVLFVLLGAIMVLAMHSGFAFLEVGTVRHKNQVNALVKIIGDFSISTIAYFFIGYGIAYGTGFLSPASELSVSNGYELVKFSVGDGCSIHFQPAGASATIVIAGVIAGITWQITPGNAKMTVSLEDGDQTIFFILDSGEFGILDQNRLG